ncbi:MAG: PAS domain-containing protein [Candidatus Eisenbacteria bacterium]|uniref:protein-glutamate O-methyltransferase n=1 Tax=Eiseniibacteriota bacterium TaxID=2212470 RepID=A0A948S141_UNCEI|nr:PAS domain-containing protein [Candidatus Eisenbacteria bacterium]MBU2693377.1 PAS domain-containing protein [Candidatus Eisenbacteria bacterium]
MKQLNKPSRRKSKAADPVRDETPSHPLKAVRWSRCTFGIVAIGASAGGLEAMESFFANMPNDSGLAFVIIQHLDPTHKNILVELLQRKTAMHVVQVKDRMRVKPDCIYIIPPNKDMSILRGVLHLLRPIAARGQRLPIDFFFRSLADDQMERGIGVILSGMGSDGTLGVRAIKENAGAAFVQDPASAKFDSMPRSVIEAGYADVVAPVETLGSKIIAYLKYASLIIKPENVHRGALQGSLDKVVIMLREKTGQDFSLYKKNMLYRRIERRMGLHQTDKIADYVHLLRENPQEVQLLFRELLIGVTSFFRDPEAWNQLKADVLPALLADCSSNQTLRAWVPACSTGEEAYSLAILFREMLEDIRPANNVSLKIFATDLDQQATDKAREGLFPANISTDVSEERLDRYFDRVTHGYRVAKGIREMILFAPQNVIMDPPFTKLDLVSCRNLLIYLTPELQEKLLPLFHYSLNPGGFLFLGNAETIGGSSNLFTPLTGNRRLFRRIDSAVPAHPIQFPIHLASAKYDPPARWRESKVDLQTLADQLILQEYSPAAVLTNSQGDILYTSGRTGRHLEAAAGKANWNIFAMARDSIRYELTVAFKRALRKNETVTLKNLGVDTNGGKHVVDIIVQPLSEQNDLNGLVMIIFSSVAAKPSQKSTPTSQGDAVLLAEMKQELQNARQELDTLREEMQTSQEELKSSNEELQSTNEELTTSEEELQSMNEELHTVNHELRTRLEEFTRTSSDIKNLLDSTDIATLFLDNNLCVLRFTSETSKITQLIPSDMGRPITDIASALFYPELAEDAHQVLRTLVRVEKQISTPDGNWYTARIQPYRTMENIIDGLVITFIDITASKKLEARLQATEARLRKRLKAK